MPLFNVGFVIEPEDGVIGIGSGGSFAAAAAKALLRHSSGLGARKIVEEGLKIAIERIRALRAEFWSDVKVLGTNEELNQALERAGRVADFIELAELMCVDALHRNESCGGHFRAESQTPEGEALRDDEHFAYVAAWEWTATGEAPILHKELLSFENVHLAQRSYA